MQVNKGKILPFVFTSGFANRSLKSVTFSQEKFWVLFGQLIRKHKDCFELGIAFEQNSPAGPVKGRTKKSTGLHYLK